MTENRYWEIVEMVGWPVDNWDRAKRRFMENVDKKETREFEALHSNKMRTLAKLKPENSDIISPEGFDDLRNHIIGLGRKEYERVLENPQLMIERYRNFDYKESFAYVIPHETDYAMLTDQYYKHRAKDFLYQEDFLPDWDNVTPKKRRELEPMLPVIHRIAQMIRDDDFEEAIQEYHKVFGYDKAPQFFYNLKTMFLLPNIIDDLEAYRM